MHFMTSISRPHYSSLPSLGDVVPMVPNLISSPGVLGKRALILVNQIFLLVVKLLSAPANLE
jgi:hypothetical protein